MIRKIPGFLICGLLCMFILFSGCASSKESVQEKTVLPEIDVVQVKEYSEEALKLAEEAKMDIQMLNSRVTEQENKLQSLSAEVDDISIARIEELETRLSLLIEAFKDLHEQMRAIEVMPRVKTKKTRKKSTFSASGELLTSSEYDNYQQALQLFDANQYSKALSEFDSMLKKFSDGDYTDDAQYWKGECYYAMEDYASAIREFKKVLEYEETSKADDAQLKLGLAYLRKGDNPQAVENLKKLINRFPASEYVPRAKKYLTQIRR